MSIKPKNKNKVLMPKGTALWLKDNTKLKAQQIIEFCSIDMLVFSSLTSEKLEPVSPIITGQLTEKEISDCEKDENRSLKGGLNLSKLKLKIKSKYLSKYHKLKRTAVIHWFLKKSEDFNRKKLTQLLCTNIGYLNRTIDKIKSNPEEYLEVVHPVQIGLLTSEEVAEVWEIDPAEKHTK